MRLSLIYRVPVRALQQQLTSRDFAELLAFEQIATLDPDGWRQSAALRHFLECKFGGDMPLERFMPVVPPPPKPFDWTKAEAAWEAFCNK